MSTIVKYEGTNEQFIVHILPQLEKYVKCNYPHVTIISNHIIQFIINNMFGEYFYCKKANEQMNARMNTQTLENYLKDFFDSSCIFTLSKPMTTLSSSKFVQKNHICIFPRYSIGVASNMTINMLEKILCKHDNPIYSIGFPEEKLTVPMCNLIDLTNMIEICESLRTCKLFITSVSYWSHVALLCGCKNIMIYDPNNEYRNIYNPFHSNIEIIHEI